MPRKSSKPKRVSKKTAAKVVARLPKLPSAVIILKNCLNIIKKIWKTFTVIALVYALLYIVFVRGISGGLNLSGIRSTLDHNTTGATTLSTGLSLFVYLIGNSTSSQNSSVNAGIYQTILLIIMSLAVIWTLRQAYKNSKLRVRDAFYRGMYPLIPFIMILIIIGLELIPLLIGGSLYSEVMTNGIAVGALEKSLWALQFIALAIVSLYMMTSTLFALYIVTLPDMTPLKAIRSARELVRGRRWEVMRKILFMPLFVILVALVIMIPVILLITAAASWIFLVLSLMCLVFIHSYLYGVYRELLE